MFPVSWALQLSFTQAETLEGGSLQSHAPPPLLELVLELEEPLLLDLPPLVELLPLLELLPLDELLAPPEELLAPDELFHPPEELPEAPEELLPPELALPDELPLPELPVPRLWSAGSVPATPQAVATSSAAMATMRVHGCFMRRTMGNRVELRAAPSGPARCRAEGAGWNRAMGMVTVSAGSFRTNRSGFRSSGCR
jgi:hypothetical protein